MTTINADMFRAYDIRGRIDQDLTPDAVELIGQSFGNEMAALNLQRVVIGRDGRLSGPDLAAALTRGLRAAGRDVIDIGMVPTPVLYYATYELATHTGIMVTGSHNPPDYNGLKMVLDGGALFGDAIQALYQRIANGQLQQAASPGALTTDDLLDNYLARIIDDIKLARPLKIGIDCGNGVPGLIAGKLFRALGCQVDELYCDVDGHFPNHHPDPSKPENLVDLQQRVTSQGFDLGLAFDGDGDRTGVLDETGKVIWPDRQMILYARDVLSRNPGEKIIYDVKCSRRLPEAILAAGGVPEMWKTGHSLVKKRLRDTGAPLAGEMSGHIFFKERWYGFDDALYTAARLLELLAADPRTTSAIFAEIPDSVNTPELNIQFAEGAQHAFMTHFCKSQFDSAQVNLIDGLRADFADGFGLVRASNTTPSLVIRFEANDQAGLTRIQDEFRSAMLAVDPDLTLPF